MTGWTRAEASHTLRWLWWTAASFPVAVLSHEAAHYAAYRLFGFLGPALHYGSATYAASDAFWRHMRAADIVAASQIVPPWQAGAAAAAGLLATYATILACLLWVSRRPHPFIVGLGLVAAVRFLGSAVAIALMIAGWRRGNGSDEENVAMTLHIPELSLHAIGVAVLITSWVVLLRIPERDARRGRAATVGGLVLGGILYIGILGPWLLP